ncbi:hypothetical protein BaRGS_00025960 [Batillaria attramentaria]|uniref:Uncharacterized protein n=1 Tax=Batillaria attramentaria TaxID=370345 RepID=A0ABD0K6E3_9CAEN
MALFVVNRLFPAILGHTKCLLKQTVSGKLALNGWHQTIFYELYVVIVDCKNARRELTLTCFAAAPITSPVRDADSAADTPAARTRVDRKLVSGGSSSHGWRRRAGVGRGE